MQHDDHGEMGKQPNLRRRFFLKFGLAGLLTAAALPTSIALTGEARAQYYEDDDDDDDGRRWRRRERYWRERERQRRERYWRERRRQEGRWRYRDDDDEY